MSHPNKRIEQAYALAKERYKSLGVSTENAMRRLRAIPISLHCWQGDDLRGFENLGVGLGGGLAATGNYPGRASNGDELRSDLDKALSLIPRRHRVNLHACYAEPGGKRVPRNELGPKHFKNWIDWAKAKGLGLDFNPTFFSHPKADDGYTLAHREKAVRQFWIEHGVVCRRIGAAFGKTLGKTCVTNVWIPDGFKDTPADRKGPRERLAQSLDAIFAEKIETKYNLDAVEPKLFGIGSESYVVGSHEFYLGYAIQNRKLLCLDTGHYHPTESIADKISATLSWLPRILLHVSRGIRWDSDHVVTLSDELQALANELVWGEYLDHVHLGLDYFDASINRVAAWVIGTRSMIKALLLALLAPIERLRQLENEGDLTGRLALMEEMKTLPFAAVWEFYCLQAEVPLAEEWIGEIKAYEKDVLSERA